MGGYRLDALAAESTSLSVQDLIRLQAVTMLPGMITISVTLAMLSNTQQASDSYNNGDSKDENSETNYCSN